MVELKQSHHCVMSYGRSTMHYSHVCSDDGIINPAMLIEVLFTMFLLYLFYVWISLDLKIFPLCHRCLQVCGNRCVVTGVSFSPGV